VYPGISAETAQTVVQLAVYFLTAMAAVLSWFTMMRG